MFHKAIVIFTRLFIACVCSLLVLNFATFFYKYTGVHIRNPLHTTDYTWEANQYQCNMREGYAWLKMDKNGFNNAYPVKKDKIDYLLMGSSHMEAVQMPSDRNAGYLLNEILPDDYVYNIGISGHNIYRCVNNLKAANNVYKPEKGIIIEIMTVKLNDNSIDAVLERRLKPINSYDSGIIYYTQKYIQSIKYLFNQISEWKQKDYAALQQKNTSESTLNKTAYSEEYKDSINRFLAFARSSVDNSKELIFVYKPTTSIDKNGKYLSTKNDLNIRQFREACNNNNIKFIDLSTAFEDLYYKEHILAHGFINSAVGVGHMNEDGHRVFAKEVARVIKKEN